MKKNLIVKQEEASDCGVCALLSIMRYYGADASLENLRMLSLTTHDGVNALNLINCAKRYGFDARGLKINAFDQMSFPIIAHVNINMSLSHFVVIYDLLPTCFDIMDPAYGHRVVEKEEFLKMFSGNIIELKPRVLVTEKTDNRILFKKIINVYKNKTISLVFILSIMLIILLCSIICNLYLNIVLRTNNPLRVLYLFIFLIFFKELLNYYINNKKSKIVKSCSSSLLDDFFLHIFRLPLKYVHLKDPGEIVKRTNELENISEFYINFILNIVTNIIIILPIFYMLITLKISSFILTFVCSILYILYVIYSNRNIKSLIDSLISSSTDYSMIVNNYITRLTSIKHVNNLYYFSHNIRTSRDNYFKEDSALNKYINRNQLIKSSMVSLFQLVNTYILLKNFYIGLIDLEKIIAINTLFSCCLSSIASIADEIPSYFYYRKLINRLNDFYNLNEDEKGYDRFIGGGVCCSNLSFSYNGLTNVIENINFRFDKNDKVFIKGISGSGKSTICKILSKELIDYKGTIRIGNVDLKKISVESINKYIGYCSQNERLFIGTIKENILLGRKISDEKFAEIIRICNLEQVIKNKPFLYDTYLYGSGDELSGGEKNLILLARCLINDKKVYILDEVLANVNEETEIKVIKNILSSYKDALIIYISHRDKSKYFNRILNV